MQVEQDGREVLILSDLSSRKSRQCDQLVPQNSTFERASQDAGYFATGKGDILDQMPEVFEVVGQENARASILKSQSSQKGEVATLKQHIELQSKVLNETK